MKMKTESIYEKMLFSPEGEITKNSLPVSVLQLFYMIMYSKIKNSKLDIVS
jgi:hypothetical protein